MWQISNYNQVISFFIAAAFGICTGIAADVLYAFRKIHKPGAVIVFFQDVLFFAILGIFTFFLQTALTSGEIRLYLLVGILLGYTLFKFTLSRYIRRMFVAVIAFFYKAISVIKHWIFVIFKAIYMFCKRIFEKMLAICKKIFKYLKKILKLN